MDTDVKADRNDCYSPFPRVGTPAGVARSGSFPRTRGWIRRARIPAAVAVVLIGLALLAGEVVIRTVPSLLPRDSYGSTRFDPETRLLVHGRPVTYHDVRLVKRTPNRHGFLDVEHEAAKPDSTFRVGFFGDKYAEGQQVPLEATYFRQIPTHIRGQHVETLAFGGYDWGTLHSLLNYRKYGELYDLDLVVYLFFANDPRDHSYTLAGESRAPLAVLSGGRAGYEVRFAGTPERKPIRKFIQAHSMLANIFYTWIFGGLSQRQATPDEDARSEWSRPAVDWDAPPSTWPPDVLADARMLTRNILADFARAVRGDGREFAVLYVPFEDQELFGRLPRDDAWRSWVVETCEGLGIPVIDPTDALLARRNQGDAVYDDHWSPAGHEVVAAVVTGYLEENLPAAPLDDQPAAQ